MIKIVKKLRRAFQLLRPMIELLRQFGKKRLIVELAMAAELPYLLPLLRNASQLPGIHLILMPVHDCDLTDPRVLEEIQPIRKNFSLMCREDVQSLNRWIRMSGLVTSEQFSDPIVRPAVCIFHGQPSKGLTFTKQVIERFDHFFHLGPLHRQALDEFVALQDIDPATLPELHEIGYPKTDAVIRGSLTGYQPSSGQSLRAFEKVILYAPAFNDHCTLRTIGEKLVATLAAQPGVGVIVKLAPDSTGSTADYYATGGVDWRQRIESLGLANVFVATDLDIGPCIVSADIMVTDVSGVGYEFLVTGKPVIYFECLDFYQQVVLPINPTLTLDELIQRDTINGGRQYGTVVRSLEELTTALSESLRTPCAQTMQQRLLYNPGGGTQMMLDTLTRLFAR